MLSVKHFNSFCTLILDLNYLMITLNLYSNLIPGEGYIEPAIHSIKTPIIDAGQTGKS